MPRIDVFDYLRQIPDIDKKDWGKEYTAPCPCGGTLHAMRSKSNGHLRAYCDTCQFSLIE